MDATPSAYLLMRLSFSAVALLAFATVSGVCAASYAKASASAPSAKEAAPFALPFMLFSTTSASALLLSGVAAMDKATNKR